MLPLILSAFLVSFTGAIFPGPILAVTIAKGCKSPWAGFQIALAHVIIDVLVILLIYFGLGSFFQNNIVQIILSIIGGILIVWLGISMFRSRYNIADGDIICVTARLFLVSSPLSLTRCFLYGGLQLAVCLS